MEVDLNLVSISNQFRCTSICVCIYFPLKRETCITCIHTACDPVSFSWKCIYMCRECRNRNIAAIEKSRKRDRKKANTYTKSAHPLHLSMDANGFQFGQSNCCCCCRRFFLSRITLEFLESFRERCCVLHLYLTLSPSFQTTHFSFGSVE